MKGNTTRAGKRCKRSWSGRGKAKFLKEGPIALRSKVKKTSRKWLTSVETRFHVKQEGGKKFCGVLEARICEKG